ncbi:MAG: autotransporter outer membrane beta-barrel domain-containing protein [Endozoicomonas sp.]
MLYRSITSIAVVSVFALLQGCGSSGSSSSSAGSGSAVQPRETDQSPRYDKFHHQKHESLSRYLPVKGSEQSLESIMERPPVKYGAFSVKDAEKLKSDYQRLALAYQNSGSKELPPLAVLVKASYFSLHKKPPEEVYRIACSGLSPADGVRKIEAALERVRHFLESDREIPAFLRNQNYLQKTSDKMWTTHKSIMRSVRTPSASLQLHDLKEDAPMLADASGSSVTGQALEEESWYFYGQGYAFKGHWQPDESVRQDYRGEGAEFGLFKTMANGFLLGGMFGMQKVRMEAEGLKSEADIYRVGPFLSWSDDTWSVDAMLTYGWAGLDTRRTDILNSHWKGSPKGSEWAAHLQASYAIPLDHWLMGLQLVPEASLSYRVGTIDSYREEAGGSYYQQGESRHKGLTTKLGSGLQYTFPDLSQPTEAGVKLGVQKTHDWQKQDEDSRSAIWPKTPEVESRDTSLYYSFGFTRVFGAELDKLIGLEFTGTSGEKSGSEMLMFTYRQRW